MRIVAMIVGGISADLVCNFGYGGTSVECFHAYLLGAIIGAIVYDAKSTK